MCCYQQKLSSSVDINNVLHKHWGDIGDIQRRLIMGFLPALIMFYNRSWREFQETKSIHRVYIYCTVHSVGLIPFFLVYVCSLREFKESIRRVYFYCTTYTQYITARNILRKITKDNVVDKQVHNTKQTWNYEHTLQSVGYFVTSTLSKIDRLYSVRCS